MLLEAKNYIKNKKIIAKLEKITKILWTSLTENFSPNIVSVMLLCHVHQMNPDIVQMQNQAVIITYGNLFPSNVMVL